MSTSAPSNNITDPDVKKSANPANAQTDQSKKAVAQWKLWTTIVAVIGFVAPLFYFGWIVAAANHIAYALTIAIILAGGALGWVIGIFISPLPDEKDQFQSYAKAVAAGISGYVLAKIDPVLTSLLAEKTVLTAEGAFRFLSFLTAFIVAMLAAFGWRRYT